MNTFAMVKKALSLTCVVYTVIISAMYLIGFLMSDSKLLFVPTPTKALLMLVFSAVVGFASLLLSKEGTKLSHLLMHVLICTVAYTLVFVVAGDFSATGSGSIVAVLFFFVIYGTAMAVRAIVCRKYRRKKTDSAEYKSVFK